MTLASDTDLLQMLDEGTLLTITPALSADERAALVQPASLDLRLSATFRIYRAHGAQLIDPALDQQGLLEPVQLPDGESFILHPGQFVLGSTHEFVSLSPTIAGKVEGKSSLGRMGLIIHSTAGFIDPGFSGHITLEMTNLAPLPIRLYPGMAIAQLAITPLHSPAARPYGATGRGSHYQGQTGPTPSRSHERFTVWPLEPRR